MYKLIKQASTEEAAFYEQVLYPFQNKIFHLIQDDRFYLSGGTCLSRFYYHHRFSDDLDFFYDGCHYSKDSFEIASREVINRIGDCYTTKMTINGEYFKRFIVYHANLPLKVEFIYENYKNVGIRKQIDHIMIDSKENLATNKLTAVYDRKTVKDFVDLYFLLNEIAFEKIVKWAQYKIVPLDYEGMAITFGGRRLEGEVLLRRPLNDQELRNFINELIQKLFDYAKTDG